MADTFSTRINTKILARVKELLARYRRRVGIEFSRSALLERLVEHGLDVMEAEENRIRTSQAPSVARVALRPDMLQIHRLPGVRYTVEMRGDLPPPAELDDSDDPGVRAARRRLSPQVGDFARVLFDDSVHVLVEGPPYGGRAGSSVRLPQPLWTKADLSRQLEDGREWAVILVNKHDGAIAPSGFRVNSDGWVALLQIFVPGPVVFWNGPFVLATCNTREAAQAVVDALLDAARMFEPRPHT